jgi:hypothetical protein
MNVVDLKDARICPCCELIFSGLQACPRCCSTEWTWLTLWLPSMEERRERNAA